MHLTVADAIQINADHSATHHFTLKYQLTPLSVHLQLDANGALTTQDVQTIYGQIYNATYAWQYLEYWRVYANPNAQLMQATAVGGVAGPFQLDVANRAYFGGYFNLALAPNATTHQVDWSTDPNPTVAWSVPNVVNHCTYTLHVEPQSGVTATMDITVTGPDGKQLGALSGPFTTNQVLAVKVPGC